jgi:hypothetical protein
MAVFSPPDSLDEVCGGPNIPPTADGAMDRIKNIDMMNNLIIFVTILPFDELILSQSMALSWHHLRSRLEKRELLPCVP